MTCLIGYRLTKYLVNLVYTKEGEEFMKLIKKFLGISLLLYANANAAIISGSTYCDLNLNGIRDADEVCTNEAVWIKLQYPTGKVDVMQPEHPSGFFSFNVNKTGDFFLFIDDNGDFKDSTPTAPSNTVFVNPASGSFDITITNSNDEDNSSQFGLAPDQTCNCDGGNGIMTIAPITIDGDVSEWATVISDPDNGSCDSGCQTDYDINKTKTGVIQTIGRNLVRFAWTGEENPNGYVYGYTKRVGSSNNTETFMYYKDGDGDGLMENGDIALYGRWQGSTRNVDMQMCEYIPADPINGDPMVWQESDVGTPLSYPEGATVPEEWVGSADGYTLAGSFVNCGPRDGLIGIGSANGIEMEWQVPWQVVGMTNGINTKITYHISTMNSEVNDNNPPGQVDDNMGNCPLAAEPGVNLTVTKTANHTTQIIGQPITYTISVTNTGGSSNTIHVNDVLPTGVSYVGYSGTNWSCTEGPTNNVSCDYSGTLGYGASSSFTITATVDNDPVLYGEILTNTACANSDENTTLVCDDANTTVLTPAAGVLLSMEKTVDNDNPREGDQVTYTLRVINYGDTNATNVVVNDTLPAGVIYDSHSPSAANYNGTDWIIPTLDSGASAEMNITATIDSGYVGALISNEACASAEENATLVCDDANLTVYTPIVKLTIQKIALPPNPAEGDTVSYAIIVNNEGEDNATGVHIEDILPSADPSVTYVGYSGANWNCTYNDPTLSCDYASQIVPGTPASLMINVTVDANTSTQTFTNNVCTQADENITWVCDDANITVNDDLDIGVTKIVDDSTPSANQTITYTITVTNYGPIAATGVEVSEDIYTSDLLTGIIFSPSKGSMIDDETWDVGDLNVNETATLTVTATVVGDVSGGEEFINRAAVTDLIQTDINSDNDRAQASIVVGCPCNDVKSDSSPAMSKVSGLIMILMTIMIGLFFIRREEQINQNRR